MQRNINTDKEIRKQIGKSILLMEFNQEYLLKFLDSGKLTKKELLELYLSENVKDRNNLIEKKN